jgi:VRR-NUC domain|nr:MAG TPA: Nuclease [Caudoviricetes sp.]
MPNLANIDNPSEDQEQEAFVQWLDDNGYPRFRVPNETYTKSWIQKAKNKRLGVSSGVPDLFVVIPDQHFVYGDNIKPHNPPTQTNEYRHRLVAIEMKRKKGGATSANQKQWIKTLNEAGIQTVVCKGCDAAIEFIESITKP